MVELSKCVSRTLWMMHPFGLDVCGPETWGVADERRSEVARGVRTEGEAAVVEEWSIINTQQNARDNYMQALVLYRGGRGKVYIRETALDSRGLQEMSRYSYR